MLKSSRLHNRSLFVRFSPWILVPFLPLLTAFPLFAAELSVQYELIARSGETPIPDGEGAFTGFSVFPAIDDHGNVVFTASGGTDSNGKTQSGIYTFIDSCCQKVADKYTLVPGGGGVTFDRFIGTDINDIDDGRVAFKADVSPTATVLGLYSNVGQANPNNLVEIARVDGSEWDTLLNPWVDGDVVAAYGLQLPSEQSTILRWNGLNQSMSYVDPGFSFNMGWETQASISGDATVFLRYKSGTTELVIENGGGYETLAVLRSTQIPGHPGVEFSNLSKYPVVGRNGQDAAFRAGGGTVQGVYKSIEGGALEKVADDSTLIPGAGSDLFSWFNEDAVALANGQVLFLGIGQLFMRGIYTDIGGELALVVDDKFNNTIDLDGQTVEITRIEMGQKSFAHTPQGYMVVFQADLASGGTALIRATIDDGTTGPLPETFTVYKDFSDNNSASVRVNLSCTSGTVTNSPQWASESSPAVFDIEGAESGATCTAAETVPSGYTANQSDCQNGDPINSSCTIVNTPVVSSNSFTVYKDFSDNNASSVSISLNCSSGTVTNNPRWASESSPAVFNISGASAGATCTALENAVPTGYTANQSDCQNGDPLNGSCTIVNNLVQGSSTFRVFTYFDDDNPNVTASVYLSCTSGTVTNNPQLASDSSSALFHIQGASPGTTCTATESPVPAGYAMRDYDCQRGDPLNSYCVIFNDRDQNAGSTFTVYKNFTDNNTASVSVSLSCSSGSVINSPQWASEASPAVFSVTGAASSATCTAIENSVPSGYTANQSDCQNGDPLNGSCTIVNTWDSQDSTFTVFKDFNDDNPASVSVSLSCSSGTVSNNPQNASEASPAEFNISGAAPGATCTAMENSVPSGYAANQSDCQNGDPLNSFCTIVNISTDPPENGVIVSYDFEDGSDDGWSLNGNVVVDGILAIGQYSLRHVKGSTSERGVSTVGYENVSVTMHIAATSLKKQDGCIAEVSGNGGNSWLPVVEVQKGEDSGTFFSGTISTASADDNSDLRLRFRASGKGKGGGYCYGDEVVVSGTPIGN